VASSNHHGLTDSVVKTRARQWMKFHNKTLPLYLSRIPKEDYFRISYKYLCENYNSVRSDIVDFVGLDKTALASIGFISPYKYHTVQGNPMRLSKENIVIKYDERWKERLSEEQVDWIDTLVKEN
jgi:hypothetical protein